MPAERSKTQHLCPICWKDFQTQGRCSQHLNQPNGKCHASLALYPYLLKARRSTAETNENTENVNSADEAGGQADDQAMDLDYQPPVEEAPHLHEPDRNIRSKPVHAPAPKGPCHEYYPGAARTNGKEPTFLEAFLENDEHSHERKFNTYYPFASADEWEFVAFVNSTKLTLSQIDEFLKLRLVRKFFLRLSRLLIPFQTAKMHLSFTSAKDLRSRIESLPAGPKWKATPWKTPYPTKKPLTLYYRDPVECLQALLSNPLVQDHIHYTPFRLWESADKLMRIYTEWLSGDHAWEIQVSHALIAVVDLLC